MNRNIANSTDQIKTFGAFLVVLILSVVLLALSWTLMRGKTDILRLLATDQLVSGRFGVQGSFLIVIALWTVALLPILKYASVLAQVIYLILYIVVCALLFVVELQVPSLVLLLSFRTPTTEMWWSWTKVPISGFVILFVLSRIVPRSVLPPVDEPNAARCATSVVPPLVFVAFLFFLPALVGRQIFSVSLATEFYIGLTNFLSHILLLLFTVPLLVVNARSRWAIAVVLATAALALLLPPRSLVSANLGFLVGVWLIIPLIGAIMFMWSQMFYSRPESL
jgi:hypothetical protein